MFSSLCSIFQHLLLKLVLGMTRLLFSASSHKITIPSSKISFMNAETNLWDGLQILLLILSKFKRIN